MRGDRCWGTVTLGREVLELVILLQGLFGGLLLRLFGSGLLGGGLGGHGGGGWFVEVMW
jgi:hypothetical protein